MGCNKCHNVIRRPSFVHLTQRRSPVEEAIRGGVVTLAAPSTATVGVERLSAGHSPASPKGLTRRNNRDQIADMAASRIVSPLGLVKKDTPFGQSEGGSYGTQGLAGKCPGSRSIRVIATGRDTGTGVTEEAASTAAVLAALAALKADIAYQTAVFRSANRCRGRNCPAWLFKTYCSQRVEIEPVGQTTCGVRNVTYDSGTRTYTAFAECDRLLLMTSTCECPRLGQVDERDLWSVMAD